MEPLLFAGDRALIQQARTLDVGCVFLIVQEGGELSLHRLVAHEGHTLIFKGDVTGSFERCEPASVIGRLAGVQFREGGEAVLWCYSWFEKHAVVALSKSLAIRDEDRGTSRGRVWWKLRWGIVRAWGRRRRRAMVAIGAGASAR